MSSSNEETQSPLLIKSRPVPQKKSSSESEESGLESEGSTDESEEESGEDTEEAEETEKPPKPVVSARPKPPSAPKAKSVPRTTNTVTKSKPYHRMVHEAMEKLAESRRVGVSIQRIVKYVNDNNDLPTDRSKFYCKKAIDKGLKDNIYVHTSGAGMSGSIVFSSDHFKNLKKEQKKTLKAEEKKAIPKSKAKPKSKPSQKPKPKLTEAKKPKEGSKTKNSQPKNDKNGKSPVGDAAAKKTKRKLGPATVVPTTKAKVKPKPKSESKAVNKEKSSTGAKTNKEKTSTEATGKAGPSTKGRQKGAVTRSKSIDA